MERKVDKLELADIRKAELKEFMHLWNQVTLETEASSLNDKPRSEVTKVKEYANTFMLRYADNKNTEIKASTSDKK